MNCHDCDQIWNQLLDAESLSGARVATGLEPSPRLLAEREQAACTHALGCPRCRLVRARYETLRRALRVWVSSARPEMTLSPALVESLRARVADCSWMFVRGVPGTPEFRGHHYLTLDVKFWPG